MLPLLPRRCCRGRCSCRPGWRCHSRGPPWVAAEDVAAFAGGRSREPGAKAQEVPSELELGGHISPPAHDTPRYHSRQPYRSAVVSAAAFALPPAAEDAPSDADVPLETSRAAPLSAPYSPLPSPVRAPCVDAVDFLAPAEPLSCLFSIVLVAPPRPLCRVLALACRIVWRAVIAIPKDHCPPCLQRHPRPRPRMPGLPARQLP
mmetsp:Transcript_84234/g.160939  ORF Transcript_84234/g.160939 Transcript_84234/m.160939 type:complete len:204 (-) Transcript_84234:91-702(-)